MLTTRAYKLKNRKSCIHQFPFFMRSLLFKYFDTMKSLKNMYPFLPHPPLSPIPFFKSQENHGNNESIKLIKKHVHVYPPPLLFFSENLYIESINETMKTKKKAYPKSNLQKTTSYYNKNKNRTKIQKSFFKPQHISSPFSTLREIR